MKIKPYFDRSVLGYWQDQEMNLTAARILDRCDMALHTKTIQVTSFMPQAMKVWMENFLDKHNLTFMFEGGFSEAERVRLAIAPSGFKLIADDAKVTVVWVFSVNQAENLEHRQVLGSLIGLGLKREVIGDIRYGQIGVYIATTKEIATFIIGNWERIGKTSINVKYPDGELTLQPDQGEVLRITVVSSRLDAVIAEGFGVSRTLVQKWISQGKVKRNDLVILKSETEVHIGDMISCRGQGRLYLSETMPTRKGRIAWKVTVFKAQRHRRDDHICK
ncbi:MAG: YlmH family RNA-binding protein [Desulfitobacteriaceae bacterium]